MSSIRVSTLPIALRNDPTFETFLSPIVAYATAKLIGAEPMISINLFGMKYEQVLSDSEGVRLYSDSLRNICGENFNPHVVSDVNDQYVSKIKELLSSKIDDGTIVKTELELMMCSCGRSQFPKDALASIALEPDIVEKTASGYRCVFCHSELFEQVTSALILRAQSGFVAPTIFPDRYRKKAENQQQILSGRPVIISRVQRNTESRFSVHGYSIDPDVWWACMPFISLQNQDEVILVTSSKTLWHAVRTTHIARLLGIECKVSVLVHPYLKILDQETKLSRMSVSDYQKAVASPAAARAFLLTGLQWGSDVSNLTSDELYLVNHSYQVTVEIAQTDVISISRVTRVLQRNTFVSLFKKLRSLSKPALTEDESRLARAVLLPW
ncbi:hypothetical protein KGO06_02555 [Patescibacteria group bacterium]|nr:hypothetical protein [Patescibacteria group bacterium]